MRSYQDLLAIKDSKDKASFILNVISEHKSCGAYKTALDAQMYARQLNVTIMKYKKLLYTITGKEVPDNFSANHKCASNFFNRFITQEYNYLLSNGVSFEKEETKKKFGGNKFDAVLKKLGKNALVEGCSFGFFNLDHVEMFKFTEFAPLWDEEDGALKGGVRFWQLGPEKPLRATLYEIDGYTEYIRRSGDGNLEILKDKRAYIINKNIGDNNETIYEGTNYPSFPIVPLWGNSYHQSELVGKREQIDCYDLIKSGFANDVDDASLIYWTLSNAGGMDDIDLVQFLERLKTLKGAKVDENVDIQSHTVDVPFASREAVLDRLKLDLIDDFMALNTKDMRSGNITTVEIQASYMPLNDKVDEFEACVCDFIDGLMALAGVEDNPVFKRNELVNQPEVTSMILSAGQYLDTETVLKKLPFLSSDEVQHILENLEKEDVARYDEQEEEETDGTIDEETE